MKFKEYAPAFARYGVGFVFFVFGLSQILSSSSWLGWIPTFIFSFGVPGGLFLLINGIIHLATGVFLITGIHVRVFSVLGFFHLLGIVLFLGWNFILVRDIGFLLVLIAVFLNGPDKLCLRS